MIRIILIAVALFGTVYFILQSTSARNYTVDVTGTAGTVFSGTCQVINGTTSSSRDAAGIVPESFQMTGTMVSCAVQKRDQSGQLLISIKRANGKTVASGSTYAAYGMATAAGQ